MSDEERRRALVPLIGLSQRVVCHIGARRESSCAPCVRFKRTGFFFLLHFHLGRHDISFACFFLGLRRLFFSSFTLGCEE